MIDDALRYASVGYRVFPCVGKTPLTQHGCTDATTDPEQIRAWWAHWPTAAVGIATGAGSNLWVLDSDMKNGLNGEQSLGQLVAQHGQLPEQPTARTPSGGFHRWFRWPAQGEIRNSVCRVGDGLDVRGEGGYVIAPPSLGYTWAEFEDLVPPEAPAWLVDLVVTQQRREGAIEIGEVIPNGRRNDTLARLAGVMRRTGMSRGAIEAALQAVNRERCSPPLSDLEVARVAASISRYEPNQITMALVEGWALDLRESQADDDRGPGPFPAALLRVPGIVSEWCGYIDRTSFKRQPVLALGAVLTACGALIGRRLETAVGGRANLYSLGVCASGGGKERARQGVKEVIVAAGADRLLGQEDLASETGLVNALVVQPCQLFQLDEIGKMLRAITNPNAGAHLLGIVSALLKLYSSAATVYKGKAYADAAKNPVINQPHACVYGTTVPDSLWESLGAASVDDGFLARCFVFIAEDQDPPRQVPEPRALPEDLIGTIRAWALGAERGLSTAHPSAAVVPMDAEAAGILQGLDGLVRQERARLRGDALGTLWTRLEQKADQLALIYAWSVDPARPRITAAAARWAADLATYLTRRTIAECRRFVAANQTEAQHLKLLRIIQDAGEDGITQAALLRKARWLRERDREEFLRTLIAGGDAQVVRDEAKGAGRPAVRIYARGYFLPSFPPTPQGSTSQPGGSST